MKSSGFEARQAEGMARALGDEIGKLLEHLVTKSDLDAEIGAVRSDIVALDAKLSAKLDALDAKLSAQISALRAQVKFMLAILAMLLALGLVDTVPQILG